MKYPFFRFKIVLNIVIVVCISFIVEMGVWQIMQVMLYGWPGLLPLIRILLLSLALSVVPLLIIIGTVVFIYITPLHNVIYAIYKGMKPSEEHYFRAR